MAEDNTIAVAIITGLAALGGAAIGVASNAIANIINRKTEIVKLTLVERGTGLFEVIKWCDSLSSSLDPANGIDLEHIQHYLPDLTKLKKYYYLFSNDITGKIETLYIHISNIKEFNNADYITDDSKIFFDKFFYETLESLKQDSLRELNKYNESSPFGFKDTFHKIRNYFKSWIGY